VEAEPSPKTLIGKDAAEISLSSRYVFGSPASGLRWEAEMRTEGESSATPIGRDSPSGILRKSSCLNMNL
jgi:hypothetical protein